MNKKNLRGKRNMHEEVFALIYEAAQAENRFRELDAYHGAVRSRFNEQLQNELAKLAQRGIDIDGALQLQARTGK